MWLKNVARIIQKNQMRCDGIDNDCDDKIDLEDEDLAANAPLVDKNTGVCQGIKKICSPEYEWTDPDFSTHSDIQTAWQPSPRVARHR